MAFADHYPLETFASIADAAWWRAGDWRRSDEMKGEAYQAAVKADTNDRARVNDHKKIFESAVKAQFHDLRADGRLGKIANLEGHEIALADAWNDFIDGKETGHTFEWLIDSFDSVWTREFVEMDKNRYSRSREEGYVNGSHETPEKDLVEAAWQKLCNFMDGGCNLYEDSFFPRYEIEMSDHVTGKRGRLILVDWRAMVAVYNEEYNLVPLEPLAALELVTASFEVPTGELMLTDFLRVEGFNDGIGFEPEREYGELSLNSLQGRTKLISVHAEEHQIAFTQTTNTCVAVYQDNNGRLIITERWNDELESDEDEEIILAGWTRVGTFSCDMWRVMAFDKAVAIETMIRGGNENAEAELNTYLAGKKDYSDNIVHLKVESGTWEITSGEKFSESADREALKLPADVHIWCLLSPPK